jgi:hypothetical protein
LSKYFLLKNLNKKIAEFRNGTKILMEDNKVTKLDAALFQPILERMVPYNHPNSFIDLSDSIFNLPNCMVD